MISVLIADDHPVVRAGLEDLLAGVDDMDVCASVTGGEEAIQAALEHQPDVVLMDLSMPGLDGIEATKRLVVEAPDVHVIALTSFSDRDRILRAIDAGAVGYLLKDTDPHELLNGIRAAARGESPLDPRAATAVVRARAGTEPADDLTPREREVLALVATGLPTKQIAERLELSEKTINAHLTSVYRRIGVTGRTPAALWAHRPGLAGHEPS